MELVNKRYAENEEQAITKALAGQWVFPLADPNTELTKDNIKAVV